MDRSSKYERVRALNAFKVALEGEGLREDSIPDFIDTEIILKEKQAAEQKYYADSTWFDLYNNGELK